MRARRAAVGLLVTALLAAGCTTTASGGSTGAGAATSGAAAGAGGRGGSTTLRWAISEPTGITPVSAVDRSGLEVVDLLFDSLTEVDERGRPRPSLALRWASQDSGRQWTFTLDPRATFHDGTPVTATDVARGWAAVVAAGRPHLAQVIGAADVRAGSAPLLRGVTAPDPHTLVVRLTGPDHGFPVTVSHPTLAPAPASGTGVDAERQPVGNGPFLMAEPWATGLFIRLARVDPSSVAPDVVREVVFETTDPTTGYVRFQQDRVDVATVPGGALTEALERYGAAPRRSTAPGVRREPQPALIHLGMDVTSPPFDEVEVRRALSRAIDRDRLAEVVGDGDMMPARSLVPPAVPGVARQECAACTRDVAEATALFAAHGVDRLELTVEAGAGDEALVDRLRADLREVGVELVVRRLAFAELLAALDAGDVGLFRLGWVTECPDAYAAVAPLVRSGPAAHGLSVNYGGYAAQDVDALLERSLRTPSRARRVALVSAAARTALDRDQAVVPLLMPRDRRIVGSDVRGLRLGPFGGPDLDAVRVVRG